MSGFTNPVCLIRERILTRMVKPQGLRRNYIWGFLGVEITLIIIMFALQADRFRYFCNVLGCSPIGGLAGTAEGMGECIGKGQTFHQIMQTWFFDYGHWLTCSLQYFASLCYLKILKEMGFRQFWQLLHAMVFTVFSGILLHAFSITCINGPSGLIANIWNAYRAEGRTGTENSYFVVFLIMWIVIFIFAVLGICCIMDHLNSFFKYALIMGAIWLSLLALVLIMGYRVLRGIGTSVENSIIKYVWPAFGNPAPLYWMAFLMFLMLTSMTMVKAMNDSEKAVPAVKVKGDAHEDISEDEDADEDIDEE